jgi:hypothetical protein
MPTKCPPHVADSETFDPQYKVRLKKGDTSTEVFHTEKLCEHCKTRIIILADRLLKIINDEGWEVDVEVLGS